MLGAPPAVEETAIDRLDWSDLSAQLDRYGYAILPNLLDPDTIRDLIRQAEAASSGECVLTATDMGSGEIFSFGANLPPSLRQWQATLYRHLAKIANDWNDCLAKASRYPAEINDFLQRNLATHQVHPQSYVSRLAAEGYMRLHQRNEGEHVFPMQIVALLSEPGKDFLGGEFVMTEQIPRMQSRPMVLPLRRGDAAIIATAQRPAKGAKGYYRVNIKHAISRVRRGERFGLELSFHNAS